MTEILQYDEQDMAQLRGMFLDQTLPEATSDADHVLREVESIYAEAVKRIRKEYIAFQKFLDDLRKPQGGDRKVLDVACAARIAVTRRELYDAVYPLVVIDIRHPPSAGAENTGRGPYLTEGRYVLTCTNPAVLGGYYRQQIEQIMSALADAGQSQPEIRVGKSHSRIPLSFAVDLGEATNGIQRADLPLIERAFDMPSLRDVEDSAADGTIRHSDEDFHRLDEVAHGSPAIRDGMPVGRENAAPCERSRPGALKVRPLGFFSATRTDFSLTRLEHYTQTHSSYFQEYVIFTNYRNYVENFVDYSLTQIRGGAYAKLVAPESKPPGEPDAPQDARDMDRYCRQRVGLVIDATNIDDWKISQEEKERAAKKGKTAREWQSHELVAQRHEAQMPAYHLVPGTTQQGSEPSPGITLINIGVGPSNAKNITDHLAVLRPRCWFMLGHCAGLRHRQSLGEFVMAQAYVRDDHVLDEEVPPWVPVPAVLEIQTALQDAVREKLGERLRDEAKTRGEAWDEEQFRTGELYKWLRIGTVATTDNRNWEIRPLNRVLERFRQSRAIAVDMESATIAANGFRFRIPYGTLLCVSDKPTFGQIKLRSAADEFRRRATTLHLQIGLEAVRLLAAGDKGWQDSRKLSAFDDPPFR